MVSLPKTRNSIRTLALPQQAVDLLIAEHKKHSRNPYLFPSPKTGTMYDPDAFRRTHDIILKAIGAEHIRFHDVPDIIGLNQNPVQTGTDLVLYFYFQGKIKTNRGEPHFQ